MRVQIFLLHLLPLVWCAINYKVIVRSIKSEGNAADYVPNSDIMLTQYNQSATIVNGSLTLAKKIPSKAWFKIDVFEGSRDGVTYQSSPFMTYNSDFCNFFENDTKFMPSLRKHSNIPDKCEVQPDNFTIQNFILEGDQWPEECPRTNRWKTKMTMYEQQNPSAKILGSVYVEIEFEKFGKNNNKN